MASRTTYHACLSCRTRMRRIRASKKDGFWEDGNGRTWPQYFVYRCPGCYSEFQFNVLTSTYE